MISGNEALLISIMGIYTVIIVWGIHHYEAKLRKIEVKKDPYSNAEHYTHLQLENQNLKQELIALRNAQPIQYESSGWISQEMNRINAEKYDKERELWEPSISLDQIEIVQEPYHKKLEKVWNSGGMGIIDMQIIKGNPE